MGMFLNFVQYNYEKGKRDSSGMCVPQTGEVTLSLRNVQFSDGLFQLKKIDNAIKTKYYQ